MPTLFALYYMGKVAQTRIGTARYRMTPFCIERDSKYKNAILIFSVKFCSGIVLENNQVKCKMNSQTYCFVVKTSARFPRKCFEHSV